MINFNIDLAANHAEQIANLEADLFGSNLKVIYGADKQIKVIYVLENKKLIAFLTFKRERRNIEIYNLGVDTGFRRQGIGSRMLNSFSSFNVSLEVRETNVIAIEFYKAQGFYNSFIRKNYYGYENALVLERKKMMTEKAYAKINLVLNVENRLPNGYHQIEFLMNSLDLHDIVTARASDEDRVIVKNNEQLSNLNNLAYKALCVMREQFGFSTKYRIEIEKNIPIAAGMAGGSSDAAAVMRIINVLEDLNCSELQLSKLGAKVGSDVSFCIYSRLAIARSMGEEIELVTAQIPTKYVLVVNPGVPLGTNEVYQNHKLSKEKGSIEKLLKATTHEQFEMHLFNALEKTSFKLCPEMEEAYNQIRKYTTNRILVSGSGPTLLVFDESKQKIKELYEHLENNYSNIHIAKMN